MKKLPRFAKRMTACAVSAAILASSTGSAYAGFMDDWFNDAGSMTNVTPASVSAARGATVITGGSFMVRNRQANFRPFWYSPPSLKVGCGGIDLYLGAIGVASKAELVAMLKNVGQASTVLAFQMALNAISPDLMGEIKNIVSKLDYINQANISSCQMASNLVAGASDLVMKKGMFAATGEDREDGGTSDNQSSWDKFKTNAQNVWNWAKSETKVQKNSDGTETKTTGTKTLKGNLVWKALSDSNPAMSTADKQLLMSIVGSVVIQPVEDSAGQANGGAAVNLYLPTVNFKTFISPDAATANITATVYDCSGDTVDCLNPKFTDQTTATLNFWGRVRTAANNYQSSLMMRDRTLVNTNDLGLLLSTPIPIVRAINAMSFGANASISTSVIDTMSQLVAYDLVAQALQRAIAIVDGSTQQLASATRKDVDRELLEEMNKRHQDMQRDLQGLRSQTMQSAIAASSYIATIEHFEKAFKGATTRSIAQNLAFKR